MTGSTLASMRDVAADAGAQLGLQLGDLIVVERMGGGDFGGGLAAMAERQRREPGGSRSASSPRRPFCASTPRKRAVIGSRPSVGVERRDRLGRRRRGRPAGSTPASRNRSIRSSAASSESRLRVTASIWLLVAGEVEQSGRVAPR